MKIIILLMIMCNNINNIIIINILLMCNINNDINK